MPFLVRVADSVSSHSKAWTMCVLIGLLAFRAAALYVQRDRFSADPDAYKRIAWTLDQSGIYGVRFGDEPVRPTAFRPPLYPWMLSFLTDEGGTADQSLSPLRMVCFHWCLVAATILLVWSVASAEFGAAAGLLAATLISFDPIHIQQSSLVMTETLAVLLTALGTHFVYRTLRNERSFHHTMNSPACGRVMPSRHLHFFWFRSERATSLGMVAMTGCLPAIAFLCRPTFLVWAALLVLAYWFLKHRRLAIVTALCCASIVGLWTWRNLVQMKAPVWATTHGGYTLLLGNNDSFYGYLQKGWSLTAWDAEEFINDYASQISEIDGEVAQDEYAGQVAKQTILEAPTSFLWACSIRVLRLWSPLPLWSEGRSTRAILLVGLYYVCFYGLVALGIKRSRSILSSSLTVPALTIVLALTAVHGLYWSNMRMRSPSLPALAVIASATVARLGKPD